MNNADMDFEEYLISKKISPEKFRREDPATFDDWKHDFQFINPDSFTVQKKFLINKIRRMYIAD
ncbi:MAG: hypothetical protein IPH28_12815 [Cytophagaceae bacterium]|nr:hypothetical protein [Cytophagaceae bacterium]MBK9508388.1 hypothetical protein [Cytophagaceae bacterium]